MPAFWGAFMVSPLSQPHAARPTTSWRSSCRRPPAAAAAAGCYRPAGRCWSAWRKMACRNSCTPRPPGGSPNCEVSSSPLCSAWFSSATCDGGISENARVRRKHFLLCCIGLAVHAGSDGACWGTKASAWSRPRHTLPCQPLQSSHAVSHPAHLVAKLGSGDELADGRRGLEGLRQVWGQAGSQCRVGIQQWAHPLRPQHLGK